LKGRINLSYYDPSYSDKVNASVLEKKIPTDSGDNRTSKGMCKNIVHEDVCISAKVDIKPIIEIGPISTRCVSKAEIVSDDVKCTGEKCSFTVRQHLCVEIPFNFGAETIADPLGMVCKGTEDGSCKCDQ
jgi:hypothetical protein